MRRAFEYFVNAGQVEKAISVAEYPYSSLNAFDTGMAELIAKALSMVSPESRAAGRLLSRYGQVLALEIGDFTGAKRAVESALVIAQREEDSALEMLILAEGARADRYGLNFDEVLSKSQRALEIALEFDDLRVQVIAEGEITLSLFCKGELQAPVQASPTYLATDRNGRFLLSAYYQGAHVAVHAIGDDGSLSDPPIEWLETASAAHAIQTDRSNKFVFVPHIARMNDSVMQPPGDLLGPNVIFQFKFDEKTGKLSPNSPLKLERKNSLVPATFASTLTWMSSTLRTNKAAA